MVHQRKYLVPILAKQANLLELNYNGDNSSLFVNEKEMLNFKAYNKNFNFPTQFCLGSISNGGNALESR